MTTARPIWLALSGVLRPPWLRLLARYVGLHWQYVARRELGAVSDSDPRVRERGGRVRGTLWLTTRWAPLPVPAGRPDSKRIWHRVRWMDLRKPGPASERWVWSEENAMGWVALAALEPAWALMHDDGEDPVRLLRALDVDEVRDVLRAAGVDEDTTARVVARMTGRV